MKQIKECFSLLDEHDVKSVILKGAGKIIEIIKEKTFLPEAM